MSEPVFCTAIARNYAAYARVLAASLAAHVPGSRLVVLIVDGEQGAAPQLGDGTEPVTPVELGLAPRDLHRIATSSDTRMLVSRLKPLLLRGLLRRARPVVLVDADSYVFDDIGELGNLLERDPILLTPHIRSLAGVAPRSNLELSPLLWGVHNGGFVAVAPSGREFADWWWDRCRRLIVPDAGSPLAYSQIWLGHACACFAARTLLDGRINVTPFDLGDRDIEWRGRTPFLGAHRLGHFHFVGRIDPRCEDASPSDARNPNAFPVPSERPGAARLYREYFERVRAAGLADASEPGFARTPDGRRLGDAERQIYRAGLYSHQVAGTAEPPNPFDEGPDAFFDWVELIRSRRAGAGL